MSISKRLIDLVRANLTSVLDRGGGPDGTGGSPPIEKLSDIELEAELRRRKQRRDAAERAADSTSAEDEWEEIERALRDNTGRYRRTGRRTGTTNTFRRPNLGGPRKSSSVGYRAIDPRLAQFYAQLECPYGADFNSVRKQYRALMRKYHPDMHGGNAEKQRIATELSQRLTMAYNELRRALTGL